jgi:hypothetical protein
MVQGWGAKRVVLALVATGLLVWGTPVFAIPMTLLSEDFNDVTGLTVAGSVRTVDNILLNNPTQLPPGTSSPSGTRINVRRADNTINTSTAANGFDSFFQPANFLVLGDAAGAIGTSTPNGGVTEVRFPFEVPLDTVSVEVQYDFAFDGIDTSPTAPPQDSFVVEVLRVGNPTQSLQTLVSPSNFSFGVFNDDMLGLTSGSYTLVFRLNEAGGADTNTAVGLDNILVTAQVGPVQTIPEPASLLLLSSGLVGLGMWRWRRKRI